jgi:hypothetical protein
MLMRLNRQVFTLVLQEKVMQTQKNQTHIDYLLAGNVNTSARKLEALARSKSYRVRERVGENPNCPASILQRLSRDAHADVRVGVSQNPNASHELLKQLSEDSCLDVPFAMAENHELPYSILQVLSTHGNPFISDRAQKICEKKQHATFIDSRSSEIASNVYWCLIATHEPQIQLTA